jgi:hypothetical protein
MKRTVFLFLFLTCFCCNSFTQENSIWGIWNTGDRDGVVYTYKYEDGSFLLSRSFVYYLFLSDFNGYGPRIIEQGNYYEIKEIIQNDGNIVSLYIETELLNHRGHILVNVKIVMHFIDQDHMWIEVDRNDEQYPTDSRFVGYFNYGPSIIFWRERVQ